MLNLNPIEALFNKTSLVYLLDLFISYKLYKREIIIFCIGTKLWIHNRKFFWPFCTVYLPAYFLLLSIYENIFKSRKCSKLMLKDVVITLQNDFEILLAILEILTKVWSPQNSNFQFLSGEKLKIGELKFKIAKTIMNLLN